jgi:ABC-type branched-subunit amino acid transport system ATPase component
MTDIVLQLANVESAYGPVKALRGVSLTVQPGEIVTVLGSNGAGKTTILKTISGILEPRKGSIHFRGEDITAADPSRIVQRGLCHVPEGREVFPLLSVRDNLLMGAYTRRDRDAVAREMAGVRLLPHPEGTRRPGRRPAVRRAAADAGHQPRADGGAPAHPARRAEPGPQPQAHPDHL